MVGRRQRGALLASLAMALAITVAPSNASPARALDLGGDTPGLSRLLAMPLEGPVRGIATFDAVPSALQVTALRGLGLTVQPLRNVPLALVLGPVAALEAAVSTGIANDVYPDERLEYLDTS